MFKKAPWAAALILALVGSHSVGLAADTKPAECGSTDCNPRHMTDIHHDFSLLTLLDKTHTSADHVAVAKSYQKQAADLEAQAVSYDELAAKYREDQDAAKGSDYAASLAKHCESVAKHMREAAAEAREMARLHGDMARLSTGKAK